MNTAQNKNKFKKKRKKIGNENNLIIPLNFALGNFLCCY